MVEWLSQIDTQLFLFLNGLHHPLLDSVMVVFSGKLSWIPVYVFFLYLIIKYYRWQSIMVLLFVALLISVSDQVSVKAFKLVFERPRPCHVEELKPLIHLVNDRCGGAFGFVSSHAANSFALAGFLWLLLRSHFRLIGPVVFTYAILVSYSRIYLGVHYPGDILAGGIIGFLIAVGVYYLFSIAERYFCRRSC